MSQSYVVCILLCTYNGSKYLKEQLNSIESQTYTNWRLIVSDDGSKDDTIEILQSYQNKWGSSKLEIRKGPQQGFCKNFLSLACDSTIHANYYCFCDQDDVWLKEKISIAVNTALAQEIPTKPFVYCGRTQYVDESLVPFAMSPLFLKPKIFRNALVQSVAGGNTMLFNNPTKGILELAGMVSVASHDWWIYQIVTGLEGVVFYDAKPQILYRQHEETIIGGNATLSAKIFRLKKLLFGQLTIWFDQSIVALELIQPQLTKQNQEIFSIFKHFRKANFLSRLKTSLSLTFYRQTLFGNFSFIFATMINKI